MLTIMTTTANANSNVTTAIRLPREQPQMMSLNDPQLHSELAYLYFANTPSGNELLTSLHLRIPDSTRCSGSANRGDPERSHERVNEPVPS